METETVFPVPEDFAGQANLTLADYERLYPIYRQLYPALQATFQELAAFEAK